MSIHSTGRGDNEPIVCSPKRAQQLLDCGNTHFWKLVKDREVITYKEGRATKVVVKSLYDLVARRLAVAKAA